MIDPVAVINVIKVIVQTVEQVKFNKAQCQVLKRRVFRLIDPLQQLSSNAEKLRQSQDNLKTLQDILIEGSSLIEKLKDRWWISNAVMASEDSARLNDINEQINQIVLDLQFGIVINIASDRGENQNAAQEDLRERMTQIQSMLAVYGKDSKEMKEGIKRIEENTSGQDTMMGMLDRALREITAQREELKRMNDTISMTSSHYSIQVEPTSEAQIASSGSIVVAGGIVVNATRGENSLKMPTYSLPPIDQRLLRFNKDASIPFVKGQFVEVHSATFDGNDVAAKCFLSQHSENRLEKEALILLKLSHPNIIKLFGADVGQGFSILELAKCSVQDVVYNTATGYINTQVTSIRSELGTGADEFLPMSWKISALLDIVKALRYLHAHDLIHSNLKPGNCLIFPEKNKYGLGVVKLANFCSTKSVGSSVSHSRSDSDVVAYLAPELLTSSNSLLSYDTPAEMYSFAVLALELLHERVPWDGLGADAITAKVGYKKDRPFLGSASEAQFGTKGLKQTLGNKDSGLLSHEPSLRFSAAEMCELLSQELEKESKSSVSRQKKTDANGGFALSNDNSPFPIFDASEDGVPSHSLDPSKKPSLPKKSGGGFFSCCFGGSNSVKPPDSTPKHHPGAYIGGSWFCCSSTDKNNRGCQKGEVRHHPKDFWANEGWKCCSNKQRKAIGCQPGPHPKPFKK